MSVSTRKQSEHLNTNILHQYFQRNSSHSKYSSSNYKKSHDNNEANINSIIDYLVDLKKNKKISDTDFSFIMEYVLTIFVEGEVRNMIDEFLLYYSEIFEEGFINEW